MKLLFLYNTNKPLCFLTKWFTGSNCFHVAFLTEDERTMYDMSLLRRRRHWPFSEYTDFKIIPCPIKITKEYLEEKLSTDENQYSYLDAVLFALRPLYHLFGKSTRNANGLICSEMVYNDLKENGWNHRFLEVPSPADLEKALGVSWNS